MLKQTSTSMPGCRIVILLIFLSGAALLLLSPVSADPAGSMEATTVVSLTVTSPARAGAASAPPGSGVTISADGDTSYYLGEKVVFRGHNYDSDTTYLFFTGPATFMDGPGIPAAGGNLTSPRQPVVSGKPDTFTPVKTKADKTWEYTWYTSGFTLDAGTYSMYAVSRPDAKDQAGPDASWVKIIVKKPFLSAEISPAAVTKGEPFTVTGTAEGEPPSVQLWIIGNNFVLNTTAPVNPGASFTFNGDTQLSGKLPEGRNYLIVQHSMQNNTFDLDVSGDYVRSLNRDNGTNIFRISGPGSLQGSDAEEALIAALGDPGNGDDTYTVIPFSVTDTGIPASLEQPAATTPVQSPTHPALVPFALFGAAVLVLGIVMWSRQ